MKRIICFAAALMMASGAYCQWKPAGDRIKTKWGEEINPENVLQEYPRPIMERAE